MVCREVCTQIWSHLGMDSNTKKNGIRTLSAPMQMSSLVATEAEETSSIWLNGRDDSMRQVDSKKLQKAEAKLLQKQEKRQIESLKPATPAMAMECQASAAQVSFKFVATLCNKIFCVRALILWFGAIGYFEEGESTRKQRRWWRSHARY